MIISKGFSKSYDVKDLAAMATDESRAERCSAAKKVLEAVIDSPDLPDRQEIGLRSNYSNGKKRDAA